MDLYSSMTKLIKSVLTRYVPVETVKAYGDREIVQIPHTERTEQLSDLDLFVGTEARVLLTAIEEDLSQEKIHLFYRYFRSILTRGPTCQPVVYCSQANFVLCDLFLPCMCVNA